MDGCFPSGPVETMHQHLLCDPSWWKALQTWNTVLDRNCTSVWKHLLCTIPDNHMWEKNLLPFIICYCLFSFLYSPVGQFQGEKSSQVVFMSFLSRKRKKRQSVAVKELVVRLRASTVTQITFNSFVWNYSDSRFTTPFNLNSLAIISWIWMLMSSICKLVSSHLRHPQYLLSPQKMIASWKTLVSSPQDKDGMAGELL